MTWTGKNAQADRYGEGRYATWAAHAERLQRFGAFAREAGIRDASRWTGHWSLPRAATWQARCARAGWR